MLKLAKVELETLIQIRNCPADNFFRLAPHHHGRLIALKNNPVLAWVANPAVLLAPLDKNSITALLEIKTFNKDIEKKGLKTLYKLGYIEFYLKKILSFTAIDPKLEKEETRCAISMLFVATGTCARECLRDQYLTSYVAKSLKTYKQVEEFLSDFKEMRDKYAHAYTAARRSELWRKKLQEGTTVIAGRIGLITSCIQEWEKLADEKCKRPQKLTELQEINVPPPAIVSSHVQTMQLLNPVTASNSPTPAAAQREMSQAEYVEAMKVIMGTGASTLSPVAQLPLPAAVSLISKETKKREPEKGKEEGEEEEDTSKRRRADEPGINPGKGSSNKPT